MLGVVSSFRSTLVHALTFLTLERFRPRVHPNRVQQNLIAPAYQSSAKARKVLTRDAEKITKTIKSCVEDGGLNIWNITTIEIHTTHVWQTILGLRIKTIHTHNQLIQNRHKIDQNCHIFITGISLLLETSYHIWDIQYVE